MRMTYKKREFARQLRQDQTAAEEKAWELLRNGQIHGLKFRRQHVIEGFVVDFYCHEHRLAIELDGGIHDSKLHREYDQLRQVELEAKGIAFIRIRNEEFLSNEQVLFDKIISATNLPSSPSGRGGARPQHDSEVRAVYSLGGEGCV